MKFSLVLACAAGGPVPDGETPNYQPGHLLAASLAATSAHAPQVQRKQLDAISPTLPAPRAEPDPL
jgi:hypothetical protein